MLNSVPHQVAPASIIHRRYISVTVESRNPLSFCFSWYQHEFVFLYTAYLPTCTLGFELLYSVSASKKDSISTVRYALISTEVSHLCKS